MNKATNLEPKVIPAGMGKSVWLSGDVYTVKLDRSATKGRISFLDSSIPPGSGAPYHLHTDADEIIFVVTGQIKVTLNGKEHIAKEGDTIFIPKHTEHGFENTGLYAARLLFYFNPSGVEQFFLEAGIQAKPGVPPVEYTPELHKKAVSVGLKYHLEPAMSPSTRN
ncbi:cupin domain-containing protein [Vibrio sp. OCN044]|uniref:Cupin domain-containing protein n=1 Tax=Vibrio tetraodonis subsp. pristinus TaxID=2695891 RepID=A0A6L8LZY5_9VIBR|nr:cupin domain-containing protein [Vibrio tetraodonis]MYM58839.1 cupin domain-containing protein [Vibrio tetraodonis subsp. pristinus]